MNIEQPLKKKQTLHDEESNSEHKLMNVHMLCILFDYSYKSTMMRTLTAR